MMSIRRLFWTILFLAALALIAVVLSSGMYGRQTKSIMPQAAAQPEVPAARPRDAVSVQHGFDVLVSLTDNGFAPRAIAIKKGQTIRFTNNASMEVILSGDASLGLSVRPLPVRDYTEVTFSQAGKFTLTSSMSSVALIVTVQ